MPSQVMQARQLRAEIPHVKHYLQRVFGKKDFRPLQEEIIIAALQGHDIFVQAATSFGKSLCFQLPAHCSRGVTVVISPLLALVDNQVAAANENGIVAEKINGNTSESERSRIETDVQCGHPRTRLLYVTPEMCSSPRFQGVLIKVHRNGQLVRVAIDEAHCISQWGHDFRKAYKNLQWLKKTLILPSVPIIALTATATEDVRNDIYRFLGLKSDETLYFSAPIARPNIHYEIQYFSESSPQDSSGDDLFSHLVAVLTGMHDRRIMAIKGIRAQAQKAGYGGPQLGLPVLSGIIYMNTRASTQSLATKLQSCGISAAAYHAGLENAERTAIQDRFLQLSTKTQIDGRGANGDEFDISRGFNIMAATSAFGMGIDMPSIRFVVHYGIPKTIEAFVQESGRGGRDGKAALSIVFYTREERERVIARLRSENTKKVRDEARKPSPDLSTASVHMVTKRGETNLQKVIDFCESDKVCRHKFIAEYFAEGQEPRGADRSRSIIQKDVLCDYACDICKEGTAAVKRRRDRGLASDEQATQFTQARAWDYE